jgi:hypothetical protein
MTHVVHILSLHQCTDRLYPRKDRPPHEVVLPQDLNTKGDARNSMLSDIVNGTSVGCSKVCPCNKKEAEAVFSASHTGGSSA